MIVFVILMLKNMHYTYMAGQCSDLRIKYITDIINGIKTIKAYCWEYVYYQKVKEMRNQQLSYVKKTHLLFIFAVVFLLCPGFIVAIILLSYHWGMERKIEYSSSIIVLSIALYLSYATIPSMFNGLNMLLKILTIFRRVNEVLVQDEFKQDSNQHLACDYQGSMVSLQNVTATWGFQIKQDIYSGDTEVITDEPTSNLIDVNLEVNKNEFLAIIGPVGSGKTSLLCTIMNELEVKEGDIKVLGDV